MATLIHAASPPPDHVRPDLVVAFDAYHPVEGAEDYQQAFSRMHRADVPDIFWSPFNGGHWILRRREHIAEAFADWSRFTSRNGVSVDARDQANHGVRPRLSPIEDDPPEQQSYRKLFAPAFTALAVKQLEADARALAVELLEEMKPRGRCDFATEFAQHLPIRIFMAMLDLPEADRLWLLPLASAQVGATPEKGAAMAKLADYITGHVLARRDNPGDDLISRIVTSQIDGAPVPVEKAIGICLLLLVGGLDTVATMMSQIMLFLAQSPAHRQALAADAKLLPNAIEEFLRRFSLTNPARAVAQDMEFHGVIMRAGDMVMLSTPLGGIDPETYDDPLAVDFARKSTTKTTFGAGPHVCPGSMLARAEIRVLLEEWLARIPDFHVDPDDSPRITTGVNITVDRLPLVW
jgi:cytochrome P450